MKRWIVVLVVLAAIAPFAIAFLDFLDEGTKLGKLSETRGVEAPADVPAAPAAAAAPVAPLPAAVPSPAMAPARRAEPEPIVAPADEPPSAPPPAGVLECTIAETAAAKEARTHGGGRCTLRVLLPTGVELATQDVAVPGKWRFTGLPTGVPLVVAVGGKGYVAGLCCDVRLAPDAPAAKRIDLLPAPTVRVSVTVGGKRSAASGLRVELRSGDVTVADAVAGGDDAVTMRPPTFGVIRARISRGADVLADGVLVPVDATSAVQERTVDVPARGTVELQVLAASGAPVRGATVWLLGEPSARTPAVSDAEGLAVFRGVPSGLTFTAVARGEGGTSASARLTSGDATRARVPLRLAEPAAFGGEVVGTGDAAVRGASVELTVRPDGETVTVKCDDSGRFETPPLPVGLADVVVRCDGYPEWRSPKPVELRAGSAAKIRAGLTPRPTGNVLVRVRDEKGEPVEGAEVFADPSRRRATTDDSGTCRFEGLDAGMEPAFFARRRGYRSRAGALPSVCVPPGAAAEVDVVLRDDASGSAGTGQQTATGVVLDPAGEAVVAARVTAGGKVGFTDAEGRFRLTGLASGGTEPIELRIAPMPSLLEPLRVLVDADEKGLADAGTVKMRARPYALLEIPPRDRAWTKGRDTAWRSESVRCFFFSSNHADVLLGAAHGAFEPFACVSYDGTWLHLPPADDWAKDARGEAFVAFATPAGLFTTTGVWTLAPDAAPRVALPPPPGPGPIGADAKKLAGDSDCYRQFHCATLFEPRDAHAPSGDPLPPVDPFASLAAWRTFVWSAHDLTDLGWQMAPGRWRVTDGGGADRTFDVRPSGAETPPK